VWNLNTKTQEAVLQGHTDSVYFLAITNNNRYVLSCSEDETVRVWNLKKNQEAVLKGHTSTVKILAITADNKYVFSGSLEKTVRVWNLKKLC
jgi:WD40 repeat protein